MKCFNCNKDCILHKSNIDKIISKYTCACNNPINIYYYLEGKIKIYIFWFEIKYNVFVEYNVRFSVIEFYKKDNNNSVKNIFYKDKINLKEDEISFKTIMNIYNAIIIN